MPSLRSSSRKSSYSLSGRTPIYALMEEYGFTNSSYFFRLYKETYGTTPKKTPRRTGKPFCAVIFDSFLPYKPSSAVATPK